MNLSISEIKRLAKLSLKGNWGLAIGFTLVIFLFNMILPTIVEMVMSGGFAVWWEQDIPPAGASIASTIISVILIPLSIAVYWFYLALIRKENPEISAAFAVYKDGKLCLKLIWTSILQAIYLFLWSLLLVIPAIIKSFSYSQTFFILRDHPEYKANQAITESKKLMKGYKWKLFVLYLSFIGWAILCVLTLGIGFLWLIPYVTTSLATFYNELIFPRLKEEKVM
ncbi:MULTISPECIES: DUF975 family protein [unclassified Bacillus (in: firmicutes)]|uniref:DUF975 family protein n=1 Tax=unclassified Bacillus (in: firmicutes) TaxID=185979 RepID=UPI0008F064A2|nr:MULTISPECIES: DUF975 family protein [unclassified Bacillus (in: firmicutes)]SFB20193.1 Uncharacterized membrane protein [Bacillus sp. UNCCL13]SFQ90832.1 Uncharacterized membrane protein [Bacillus sp. cl95]